jgi:hypothetical protein
LRLAVELALLEFRQRMQVVQRRQCFLVVEAGENVAAFYRLALAETTMRWRWLQPRSGSRPRASMKAAGDFREVIRP